MKNPIFVTQPSIPELSEFILYLEKVWSSKTLTNNGPFLKMLEEKLSKFLNVPHISLYNNGTTALISALRSYGLTGEVITTPFSFVATAHAITWNGLNPVFVDIDEETLNIDPERVREAITESTSAILPVHCYGNPCDYSRIQQIAHDYDLRTIYDAAHAFSVSDDSGSILQHGDLSVLSLHATKVFSTIEGGAVISKDPSTKARLDQLRNFGFVSETDVESVGLNGKMSELNAAFGLAQLDMIDSEIKKREQIDLQYRSLLSSIKGIRCHSFMKDVKLNYSYFPVFVTEEYPKSRDALYLALRDKGIYARRYFFPLISDMAVYRYRKSSISAKLPIATKIANQIICLPIYSSMHESDVERIADIIASIKQ